jgi:hypothetical protein
MHEKPHGVHAAFFTSTDDFAPFVGKSVVQSFRAAPKILQTTVATVMGDTAPDRKTSNWLCVPTAPGSLVPHHLPTLDLGKRLNDSRIN